MTHVMWCGRRELPDDDDRGDKSGAGEHRGDAEHPQVRQSRQEHPAQGAGQRLQHHCARGRVHTGGSHAGSAAAPTRGTYHFICRFIFLWVVVCTLAVTGAGGPV
eukprot:1508445-Pyramimonas_sp.AAC.1